MAKERCVLFFSELDASAVIDRLTQILDNYRVFELANFRQERVQRASSVFEVKMISLKVTISSRRSLKQVQRQRTLSLRMKKNQKPSLFIKM